MSTGDASYTAALEGRVSGVGRRFAVVASRFNAHVTDVLLERAVATLREHGAGTVDVFRVPGAWELPQACARLARNGDHDAVLAVGCLVRGDTPHFDVIAAETARGLGQTALDHDLPVLFGVLTTETDAQAVERADPERGDKGREVALAMLEMADLFDRLRTASRAAPP